MSLLNLFPKKSKKGPEKRKLSQTVIPTGVERHFHEDEVIVSKTDLKGKITYANDLFLKIADYTEQEILGAPHSILRHPDMPRAIFKLLWDMLKSEKEIFAYVLNLTKYGDHYWVFAHVTPSFNDQGQVVGYHSFRRMPNQTVLNDVIIPLYQSLKTEEDKHDDRKTGLLKSFDLLCDILDEKEVGYEEFILSI